MSNNNAKYHEAPSILIANKEKLIELMNSVKNDPVLLAFMEDHDYFTGEGLGAAAYYNLNGSEEIEWTSNDLYHFEKYNIIFDDRDEFEKFLLSKI